MTGAEIDALNDAELEARLAETAVFARTSPAHKLRLVECLQAGGARVAMTGDGVNGGLVLVVCDDPGIHSSQNEQDTRLYGALATVPVLEPSDAQEALEFTRLAFALSEQFDIV